MRKWTSNYQSLIVQCLVPNDMGLQQLRIAAVGGASESNGRFRERTAIIAIQTAAVIKLPEIITVLVNW